MPPTSCEFPLRLAADGMCVAVRLTPRARTARIDGVAQGRLKVAVTAPPAENQANDALLRLLSREWRLPLSSLSIAAGARSRNKLVHIAGDPAALTARIQPLLRAP